MWQPCKAPATITARCNSPAQPSPEPDPNPPTGMMTNPAHNRIIGAPSSTRQAGTAAAPSRHSAANSRSAATVGRSLCVMATVPTPGPASRPRGGIESRPDQRTDIETTKSLTPTCGLSRRNGPVLGDGAAAAEAVASTCAEPTCDPHPGRSGPGRPGRAPRRPGFRRTSRKALIQVVCFIY
jgi:hypothetical protein